MENTGIEQAHELAALPRRTRVFPPVLRAGLLRNIEFLRSRRIETLQCCIHLEGEAPGGEFAIDGARYAARYPYLLIKRPGELHEAKGAGRFSSFYFACAPDTGLLPLLPPDLHMAELELTPELAARIREIRTLLEHTGDFGAGDRIDAACHRLLLELLLAVKLRNAPPSPEAEKIGRAVSHLRLRFTEPTDWEELAAACGFSLRSFTRHWRQVMHCSPGEYVAELRMAEARRLLADTERRVADIALALGYRSPESFINAFRLRHGVSPLKFRIGGNAPPDRSM